jgi:hypothetical protein
MLRVSSSGVGSSPYRGASMPPAIAGPVVPAVPPGIVVPLPIELAVKKTAEDRQREQRVKTLAEALDNLEATHAEQSKREFEATLILLRKEYAFRHSERQLKTTNRLLAIVEQKINGLDSEHKLEPMQWFDASKLDSFDSDLKF